MSAENRRSTKSKRLSARETPFSEIRHLASHVLVQAHLELPEALQLPPERIPKPGTRVPQTSGIHSRWETVWQQLTNLYGRRVFPNDTLAARVCGYYLRFLTFQRNRQPVDFSLGVLAFRSEVAQVEPPERAYYFDHTVLPLVRAYGSFEGYLLEAKQKQDE